MEPAKDQPPLLAYRSGFEEPRPPSVAEILGGLALVVLAVGAAIVGVLGLIVNPVQSPWRPFVSIPISMVFFLATSLLLGRAYRCFSRKAPLHLPRAFSQQSSRAMRLAAAEALSRNDRLDVQHLLLGLLDSAPNAAVAVLTHLAVDLEGLREHLQSTLPRRQRELPGQILDPPPQTERFLSVLKRAISHAQAAGLLCIGTECLLLAVLAECGSIARLRGLTARQLEAEIDRLRPALAVEQQEEAAES